MSRLTRVFLFLVLMGFIPIVFSECSNCKCEDPGPDKHYVTDSIEINTYYDHLWTVGFDTASYYPYDSVSFKLSISKLRLISSTESPSSLSFSLTSSAYACSCVEPNEIMDKHITSIQITSKTDCDYNSTISFKVGDSIGDYFNVPLNNSSSVYKLEDFVSRFNHPSLLYQNVKLYLNIKPSQAVTVTCDIQVKFNDGKVFLFENQQLKVK